MNKTNKTNKMVKAQAETLSAVVSKIVSAKKAGSIFTKTSVLSSVQKKVPSAKAETILRYLRSNSSVSYNRKNQKYTRA